MYNKGISIIVPGSLNTDIMGLNVSKIVSKGELSFGGQLQISPGGKSRNIAHMIALLVGKNRVAMLGKTSKDPFGLWQIPVEALKQDGVDTTHVKILAFSETKKYPGIALIPVDKNGNNQIYVLPGINEDFFPSDINDARPLFKIAKKNKGILALSLELPLKTAIRSIELGTEYGLKCIIDPGGIDKDGDYTELLRKDIFLIKPNEHEAKILTGINITDFASARKSAHVFLNKGIKNILITAGKNGAYFFNEEYENHIKAPSIDIQTSKDETGCGDQTMATLCAYLSKGSDIVDSINTAIVSGTLQFFKQGVQPIKEDELNDYLNKFRNQTE